MKKFTIFILAICFSFMGMAQTKFTRFPVQSVPATAIKNQFVPSSAFNPLTVSKSVLEDILGNTYYDMQTNCAMDTRIITFQDGTMGATWTRGTTNNNDRGTGYNYFDGTAWGPEPTARIENARTGWPSYTQVGPEGEFVIAHLADGLKISQRATKGTGTWNQSVIFGPTGATDISWPRVISSGPEHNYVHMMIWTYVAYQGLDLALLYYRSPDGGQTWDITHQILPQLTSADYDGFNGDQVAWGTPHGDTIYFVVSGPWVDTFIMTSPDNGNNWTKIPILSNAYKKLPAGTTYVPPFTMSDGSCAVEMDNNGVYHVAFGMGGGSMTGGTASIFINMDGLIYWNSTMPMLQDSLDMDVLEANGQLLGRVVNGPLPGDTIVAVPNYKVALTSFPQISIDEWNNVYFIWSAATPGMLSEDNFNYRHLWGRAKFHDKTQFSDMIDFNSDFIYVLREFVYPSMAKNIMNNELSVIYQTAGIPGSNIITTTIPQHESFFENRIIPVSSFFATGTGNSKGARLDMVSQNFPNPVHGITNFNVRLEKPANVVIEISNLMGQTLRTLDKGAVNAGSCQYTLDCSDLTPGVYFYTVRIDGTSYAHKMIVE